MAHSIFSLTQWAPLLSLPGDRNKNLVGDACDNGMDRDFDGIPDLQDNCPDNPNSDQLDSDEDGMRVIGVIKKK